jgi:hypothetical protein
LSDPDMRAVRTLWVVALVGCTPVSSLPAGREDVVRRQLPAGFGPLLEQADTFELLALDEPGVFPERMPSWPEPSIRARVPVSTPDERLRVVSALYRSIARAQMMALCFHPHHAIRTTRQGATFDVLICLNCMQIAVPAAKEEDRYVAIHPGELEPALSAIFERHGLRFDRTLDHFGRWIAVQ